MPIKPLILAFTALLPAAIAGETAPAPQSQVGCKSPESRLPRAGGGKGWQKSFDLIYRKTAE